MVRLPFTNTGLMVLLLGLGAYAVGWWFGWTELLVMACGCLTGLVLATPFIVGRQRLIVERTVAPERVEVGSPAVAHIRITNPTRIPIGSQFVAEHVDGLASVIDVTGLAPGASIERSLVLPTDRRGLIPVGPSIVSRADPLGLMRRDVVQSAHNDLWVHPRVVPTNPAPVGFAKDLEGPTNDTSPSGDVSFHTLREYSIGDDPRHVHWLSTARTGSLMVKHFVDNRQPHLTVVLDGSATSYQADEFEVAVDVVASLGVNGLIQKRPTSLYSGAEALVPGAVGATAQDLLDALTVVQPRSPVGLEAACVQALDREPETSVLVAITGAIEPSALLGLIERVKRRTHVVVVRAWPSSAIEPVSLPGATILDIDDIDRFQVVWNQAMR